MIATNEDRACFRCETCGRERVCHTWPSEARARGWDRHCWEAMRLAWVTRTWDGPWARVRQRVALGEEGADGATG